MRILSSLFIIAWCATITATAQVIPINQFKQRSLSDTIKAGEIVAGRVTVANQFSNTCFIQDGTGGIAIFNNNFRSGVAIGDSVHITGGTYQEFQATTGQPGTGLGQIAGSKFVFTVIPVARVPQAARTVAITSVGEASEATLIRLRNVKFTQTGLFQGDVNYFVKNAQGDSIQVRIDRATDIAVAQAQIPTDNVDMTAVVSQFRGTYQIQPRFGADLGLVIERDTVSKSRTMDITTWNLLWFGKVDVPGDSAGPTDKARQFTSIRRAMDSVGADIYALQEVVSEDALNRLRDSLAIGYNTLIASEINQTQKMAYLFNKQTVEKVESGLAVNGGAQAWANGRFPFRLAVNATVNGVSRKLMLFNIHAKATATATQQEDYERRRIDAETFHKYLNDFYKNDNVIVLGDFNDDILMSVVEPNPSPYRVFLNDTNNWVVPTEQLARLGLASYVGLNRSMLDNVVIKKSMEDAIHNVVVEPVNALFSSYSSTVSDHLPVTTRLFLNEVVTSVQEEPTVEGAAIRIAPNPVSTNGSVELVNETPGMVSVTVTDVLGNTVMTLENGIMEAQIKLYTVDATQLASGTYSIVMMKNGASTRVPFVVVK